MSAIVWTGDIRKAGWMSRLLDNVREHQARRRTLRDLRTLSDERLLDIGVDRADIGVRMKSELARIDVSRLGHIGLC